MGRASLVTFALLAAVSFVSFTPDASASTLTVERALTTANAVRAKRDLPSLVLDARLARGALAKAQEMLTHQYFDHTSPSGTTFGYWFKSSGYPHAGGENLAAGFDSSDELIALWLASPVHAANLLSSRYTDTGIAIVSGMLLGKRTTIAVQLFGRSIGPAPKPIAVPVAYTTRPSPVPKAPATVSKPASVKVASKTPTAASVVTPLVAPTGVPIEPTVAVPTVTVPVAPVPTSGSRVAPSNTKRFVAAAPPIAGSAVASALIALLVITTLLLAQSRVRQMQRALDLVALLFVGAALLEVNFHILEGMLGGPPAVFR